MKTFIRASILLCCVSLLPLTAAYAAQPPGFVAESAHTVAGSRSVEVTVGQAEIKSDINPSNIAVATGGGLLGALIQASVDAERAKKAEAAISPVRDAMVGFDADGLAISTTKNALANVEWLPGDTVKFSKDSTPLGKGNFLDSSDAPQAAFFDYSYDFSPDFSSVRVVVNIQFANKVQTGSTSESRFKPGKLAYAQSITAIVVLPETDKDINVNAQRWAADGGKLTQNALTIAFGNVEKLIPRTLALTEADIKAMNSKDKPRKNAGGFMGRVQEENGGHALLWSNGFIQVDPLPQDQ